MSRSAIQQAIGGFRVSQMLYVAAKLRLADHLAEGPRSVQQLAAATGAHEDSLYRLLRTLASHGFFAEDAGRVFRLTPSAAPLRSDVPGSLRLAAEVVGEDWMWRAWSGFLHSVMTGESAFDRVFGESTWSWFERHPADGALFDRLMEATTAASVHAVVDAFDFTPFPIIVDVAGGQGLLLETLLRRHPQARGVLFNLPRVLESITHTVEPEIAARLRHVGGDFFQSVPDGGDLYVLKNILHDWNDDRARDILRSCWRAMPGHARLLIIETLVGAPNESAPGKIGDLQMLVRLGGRNRTEDEFRALLASAGFELARIVPTDGGPDIVEATRGASA